MAKKKVVKNVALTPEQEKKIISALISTWQVIGCDVLALDNGRPVPQAVVIEMCAERAFEYGNLTKEERAVYDAMPYSQWTELGRKAFPYARYS
jgi:hypothetical protein